MEAAMPATLEVSVGPQLTAEQAEEIYKQGKEAVVFALLEMAKKLAEQQSSPAPSTPSGVVAPYQKPCPKGRGKRSPAERRGIRVRDARCPNMCLTRKNTAKPLLKRSLPI